MSRSGFRFFLGRVVWRPSAASTSTSTAENISSSYRHSLHKKSFSSQSRYRFFHSIHRSRFSSKATMKMSSLGMGSAGLYAVVSSPAEELPRPDDAALKKHHKKGGKVFINPWDSFYEFTPLHISWAMIWRKLSGKSKMPDLTPPTVPVRTPELLQTRETTKLRATWLGHACYYVEFPGGLRVLFDPVFEDCCAPTTIFKFLKRYTPPPCEIEDLPIVDIVVISHNHYDHLSYPTTERLVKKFPNVHFFVPLGNRKWFESINVKNVTELDWWESRNVKLELRTNSTSTGSSSDENPFQGPGELKAEEKGITASIGALPCQHVSARTPFDRNKTLWASWSVESGGAKVYFAGDTGYRSVPDLPPHIDDYSAAYAHLPHCPAFAQIGQHRGPFDLGLIPIGAYEPRWIMSPMHADPKDAVNIFKDTKCRKALGMHWGTWVLTEEEVKDPARKLKEAMKEWVKEDPEAFGVVDIGESKEFETGS
ncbi:Metallo-hydrolase/oxidoreductase [Amniculicola lignicola CBS 123094]|uniref:Metallo-hydrolase/oxidoreductase n=1 Tax=Amniculicola lignicola CBS 123094 TaxID=1392246 RepID=A0A6A5WFC2_9PLEO|nr:Metallo-hydrolase/oxidoreductase [Amniculicola lignicola CBS 123094]